MAHIYKEIDSINDINLKKIVIKNINIVRYVDREGNRYATRFNLRTRRIDIVRIAIGDDEVIRNRNKRVSVSQKSHSHIKPSEKKKTDNLFDIPEWAENIVPKLRMPADTYFQQIEKECEKFSERARGLINFIKASEAFERTEHQEGDFILDINTFFDRSVQNPLSETQNLVVEFLRFPKPPASYVQNLSVLQKKYFDTLADEDQKIFLKGLIVGRSYLEAMKGLKEMTELILAKTEEINEKTLKHDKKRVFQDLIMTSKHVLDNLEDEASQLLDWMQINKVILNENK